MLPKRETLTVEFKSDRKKLSDAVIYTLESKMTEK